MKVAICCWHAKHPVNQNQTSPGLKIREGTKEILVCYQKERCWILQKLAGMIQELSTVQHIMVLVKQIAKQFMWMSLVSMPWKNFNFGAKQIGPFIYLLCCNVFCHLLGLMCGLHPGIQKFSLASLSVNFKCAPTLYYSIVCTSKNKLNYLKYHLYGFGSVKGWGLKI